MAPLLSWRGDRRGPDRVCQAAYAWAAGTWLRPGGRTGPGPPWWCSCPAWAACGPAIASSPRPSRRRVTGSLAL